MDTRPQQPAAALTWPSHESWRDRLVWRHRSDRPAAEASITAAYGAAGLPPPRTIIWAEGPREARELLERTAWRRAGPWLLMALAVLAVAMSVLGIPEGLDLTRASLPRGAFIVLGLSFVSLWAFALLLSGALNDARTPVVLLAVPLVTAAAFIIIGVISGNEVRISPLALLGGLIALPASILLAVPGPKSARRLPILFGRSVAPRMSRAFQGVLDRSRRGTRPAPYGLELGDRLAAFVRLLAVACPPSFETPILFYAVDRLVRITPDPKTAGEAERHLAAFTDMVFRVDGLWAFRNVAIVLTPPTEVHLDEFGRFHRIDGPAISWADGSALFAVDGRFASDPMLLLEPESLSVLHLRQEPDPGVRRALLAQYGPDRLMHDLGRKVGADHTGELWRIDDFDGEPLVMVRVINSSPEPDGSYKPYWLRVPPTTPSAHAGVAWTFGLTPLRYAPQVET